MVSKYLNLGFNMIFDIKFFAMIDLKSLIINCKHVIDPWSGNEAIWGS